jgi:predicted metal-dependent enzyme (double-stranded beta helix superfamily)
MARSTRIGTEELIAILDASVRLGEVGAITRRIQERLSALFGARSVELPARFYEPLEECYARRLLHRDVDLGYTAVVMTWGPGQKTPLHDHAGIWCVEGVVEGTMHVTRYRLVDQQGDLCRFQEMERVRAGVGSSGSLLPPFEYHVLANAHPDRTSITLHVYGGEMDHCCIYRPREDGWFERSQKALAYH